MYGDERRTEIAPREDEIDIEDMIAVEEMVIAITKSGYVKRLPVSTYRTQNRGGIGVMGMDLKDGDYIEHLFITSTHHFILFITSRGKIYRLKVHELPLGSRQSKGRAIVNLLPLAQDEEIKAVIATKDYTDAKYLVFATRNGLVKKTAFKRLQHPAQGRRHHRHQPAGRRRTGRRQADQRRRRPDPGVQRGQGHPLPRVRRAAHGPEHPGRHGHAPAPRPSRGRHGHGPRRRRPVLRDLRGLRQAHPHLELPGTPPGRPGRHHHQGRARPGRPGGHRLRARQPRDSSW